MELEAHRPRDAHLRPFEQADLAPVRALVVETIDRCYGGVYPPRAVAFFKRYHGCEEILDDACSGLTLVATRGERLAGTGTLVAGSVRRVFVHPLEQRQGLGRTIMAALEAEAVAAGHARAELDASLVAETFYLGLGYEILERTRIDVGAGEELVYARMAKQLAAVSRGAGRHIR